MPSRVVGLVGGRRMVGSEKGTHRWVGALRDPCRRTSHSAGDSGEIQEGDGEPGEGRNPRRPCVPPPTHLPLLFSILLACGDHRMLLGLCPVPPASSHCPHGAPTGMSWAPALPRSRMDDLGAGNFSRECVCSWPGGFCQHSSWKRLPG